MESLYLIYKAFLLSYRGIFTINKQLNNLWCITARRNFVEW